MSHLEAFGSVSTTNRHMQVLGAIDEMLLRIKPTEFAPQRPTQASASARGVAKKAPTGSLAPHHLRRATELLLANLSGPMGVIEIAHACNLTRSHFSRAFKLSTGVSPVEWRLNARLEKAKALLSTPLTLTEVSLEAGFCDQSHFTKSFTRLAGMNPKAWRAEMANDAI